MFPAPIFLTAHLNRFKDVARANRFNVMIGSPMNNINGLLSLMMQCESAELPGKEFNLFEAKTSGQNIKFPFQTDYSPLVLGFFCVTNTILSASTGLPEKRYFDKWMSTINPMLGSEEVGQQHGHKIAYKNTYAVDITVTHLDADGLPTYKAVFKEAYPVQMQNMQLNWGSDDILRLTMTFTYSEWSISKALI